MRRLAALCAAALLVVAVASQTPASRQDTAGPFAFAAGYYAQVCAGCHGTDLAGGRGPSLFDPRLLAARTDQQMHDTLVYGIAGTEMASFKDQLDDAQMWQMVAYLRTHAAALRPHPVAIPDPVGKVIRSQKQAFRIVLVADGLSTPWGLAWLPDGRLLVTERPGRLRIVDRRGHLSPAPVSGTPAVWERQDSGLLDVAVHPDYARNGWIYLAYTDVAPGHVVTAAERAEPVPGKPAVSPPSMTVIVRGRIRHGAWVDGKELFRAPTALYTSSGSHYGCRLLFDGRDHLYFTLGDRGEMGNAQRLDVPLGKIHRINADGTVPADNPFVHRPGALPTIWSYGHRNPEGLAIDPATGQLWESEHGPTGGDELNLIRAGHDYGWGVASMGIQPGITRREAPGMDPPIVYWTPSIAPSGIGFYAGSRYPGWRGSLFVGGLVGQQLRRIEIAGDRVVSQEIVMEGLGRVRAVKTGPDGLLYLLLQDPTGTGTNRAVSDPSPGRIVRLDPLQ